MFVYSQVIENETKSQKTLTIFENMLHFMCRHLNYTRICHNRMRPVKLIFFFCISPDIGQTRNEQITTSKVIKCGWQIIIIIITNRLLDYTLQCTSDRLPTRFNAHTVTIWILQMNIGAVHSWCRWTSKQTNVKRRRCHAWVFHFNAIV